MFSSFSICACARAVSGRKRAIAAFQVILRRNELFVLPAGVALQFEMRASREDAGELVDHPFVVARAAVLSFRVLCDELERESRVAFRTTRRARGDELAEIFVAFAIADEHRDAVATI